VNTSDIQNAIMKWRGYPSKASLMPKDFYEFAAFIGYPHKTKNMPSTSMLVDISKPEVRNVIDLINGPNGNAILKILEIRYNDRSLA
jgi:hypothetical protein